MSEMTAIEWTDATWNVITGCSITSPGCRRCYAMKLAGTRLKNHPSRAGLTKPSAAGPVWTGEVRFNPQWLDQPQRWRRARDIFVCAHGDLFHESVPDRWIDQVFAVMANSPWHRFQVLTKRAARMRRYLTTPYVQQRVEAMALELAGMDKLKVLDDPEPWPLRNVILMVSAERQQEFDARIVYLLSTPAARSADDAAPMHAQWVRDIRDQCAAAGTPLMFKQWGSWLPGSQAREVDNQMALVGACSTGYRWDDGTHSWRIGKKAAGRLLDGVEHNGFPEVLR